MTGRNVSHFFVPKIEPRAMKICYWMVLDAPQYIMSTERDVWTEWIIATTAYYKRAAGIYGCGKHLSANYGYLFVRAFCEV